MRRMLGLIQANGRCGYCEAVRHFGLGKSRGLMRIMVRRFDCRSVNKPPRWTSDQDRDVSLTASVTPWPCETRTSSWRSFATISSGLYRFLVILSRYCSIGRNRIFDDDAVRAARG